MVDEIEQIKTDLALANARLESIRFIAIAGLIVVAVGMLLAMMSMESRLTDLITIETSRTRTACENKR